jgi:hypothetical protein
VGISTFGSIGYGYSQYSSAFLRQACGVLATIRQPFIILSLRSFNYVLHKIHTALKLYKILNTPMYKKEPQNVALNYIYVM